MTGPGSILRTGKGRDERLRSYGVAHFLQALLIGVESEAAHAILMGSEEGKKQHQETCRSFEEAVTVFYDPLSATFDDPDHSDTEAHLVTIGYSSRNRLLLVSHLDRGEILRINSARAATAHERKRHEEEA